MITQGYRHDFGEDEMLNPGEYGRYSVDGEWYCVPPGRPDTLGKLSNHQVIEHDDETITVTPSILITHHLEGRWHGYLERGIWREVQS